MAEVQIREGEDVNKALRRFRRKVQRAGILKDFRKHRHYEKPSGEGDAKPGASDGDRLAQAHISSNIRYSHWDQPHVLIVL